MWTNLSVSRWIFLLTLAAVMFISASHVNSLNIGLPCCDKVGRGPVKSIKECYEQKPRQNCNHHAYLIIDRNGTQRCIDPSSKWLKARIRKGLKCDPVLSLSNQG